MQAMQPYQNTWAAYQEAVNTLYAAPPSGEQTGFVTDTSSTLVPEQHIERVLASSAALRETLAYALQTDNQNQRELAALKLLATAGYDLAVSGDLLQAAATGSPGGLAQSARSAVLASDELRTILDAPLAEGMTGLLAAVAATPPADPLEAVRELREAEALVPTSVPGTPRTQLTTVITTYLADVSHSVTALSEAAIAGIKNLSLGTPEATTPVTSAAILARVPDRIAPIQRGAAQLAAEAIHKLWAATGVEQEEQFQQQVASWLRDLLSRRYTTESLLDHLYETQRIAAEMTELIEIRGATASTERYDQALQALRTLLRSYRKATAMLERLTHLLALIELPFLGAGSWGQFAVYAAYLAIFGYAIFNGGDYVDWYRTEGVIWPDRVQGLRETLRRELA